MPRPPRFHFRIAAQNSLQSGYRNAKGFWRTSFTIKRKQIIMIRVIIADDFSAMEKVMETMIRAADDMELVGIATDFRSALALVQQVEHDVIILNDYLPPLRSPLAIRRIREAGVTSAIVVVSMHEDAELAHEALEEGASGYVLKPNFLDEFEKAIRDAHAGKKFGSPGITAKLKALLGDAADALFEGEQKEEADVEEG